MEIGLNPILLDGPAFTSIIANRFAPYVCGYMPAIIRFLGYNPLPAASTLAEQLVRQRTSLGLSQKEAARQIGVDPGTLARWERGEREPVDEFVVRAKRFLHEERVSDARRAG